MVKQKPKFKIGQIVRHELYITQVIAIKQTTAYVEYILAGIGSPYRHIPQDMIQPYEENQDDN